MNMKSQQEQGHISGIRPRNCRQVCSTRRNINRILKFFAAGQLTDLKRSKQNITPINRKKRSLAEGLIQMSPGYNILQALFRTSDNTQEINSNFQQIAETIDNMSQNQVDMQEQLTTIYNFIQHSLFLLNNFLVSSSNDPIHTSK